MIERVDQPTTVAISTAALHEEWAEIPTELLQTLAEGMPHRTAVIYKVKEVILNINNEIMDP